MIVCDRCGGKDDVQRATAEVYTGDRPEHASQAWNRMTDLCRGCRTAVQAAIASALEPLPRPGPEPVCHQRYVQ